MTPDQIQLVRESFAKVVPIRARAAALFYDRLFQTAPELRAIFPEDLGAQGAKLMAALGMVVVGLDRLETILPQVQDLGRRDASYGATTVHYAVVGAALIWTLGEGLGDDFTPAVRTAWIEAYALLSGAMIAAEATQPLA